MRKLPSFFRFCKVRVQYLRAEMSLYPITIRNLKTIEIGDKLCNEIIYLKRVLESIELSLAKLEATSKRFGPLKRKAIEKLYWRTGASRISVSTYFELHENTLKNWDKEFLLIFASVLGVPLC